jgi:PIN domain nuclease of toxin-antitoxin system
LIVLDTHALIWWADEDARLAPKAKAAIDDMLVAGGKVLVSAITAWEIAMLVQCGRLVLAMNIEEWLRALESIKGVSFVPITPQVAFQSVNLPGQFHLDPADRIIVALARALNAPLVTADEKIQRYAHVRWLW